MFTGACSATWPKSGPLGSPLGGIDLGESSLAWSPCTGSWGSGGSLAALQGLHFLPGACRRGASRPQAPWPASVGNLRLYLDTAQAGLDLLGTGCGSPGRSSEARGLFRKWASGRSAPGALLRSSSQLLAWVPGVLAGVLGSLQFILQVFAEPSLFAQHQLGRRGSNRVQASGLWEIGGGVERWGKRS